MPGEIVFSHERLTVYQDCLVFIASVGRLLSPVDAKYAFADHLTRAAESVAVNLVEACREEATAAKELAIDYSLGSVLECAACLDLGCLRPALTVESASEQKQHLRRIFGKLIGLRKSWREPGVAEDGANYETEEPCRPLFHHENLDVYRAALAAFGLLLTHGVFDKVGPACSRRMDELATTVVLNVAEGNGRFHTLDKQRFLKTANRAAVKMAVVLDVAVAEGVLLVADVDEVKKMLARVARMSAAMGGLG